MAAKKTRIEIILEAVDKATGPINERLKATEERMAHFRQKTDRIASALTGFGTAATASGVAVLGAFGVAVKKAADMESLTVALNTAFQGNEAAANAAFNTIRDFAARTPYQLEEVMRSFIKLKNMGLDPSQAALESYGNTASSMGKSLNDMIEAVADAATGEFERLKEFGIKAKTQGDQVSFTFRGVETTVQKNAEQIERYLMRIGQTDFAGGMEKQSQTLNGRLSTLRDNLDMTAAIIGRIFLPAVSDMVAGLTPVLERIAKFAEANPMIFKMAAGFGVAAVAVGGFSLAAAGMLKAVSVIVSLYKAAQIAVGVFQALNVVLMANPIILITMAVIALIAAVAALVVYWKEITEWWQQSSMAIKLLLAPLVGSLAAIIALAYAIRKVIDNWPAIVAFFDDLIKLVSNLPSIMYEAGKNIVSSIEDGISAAWSGFIKRWEERIQKLRDYLPFSPAKTGPLRDIHRIQLMETIADTITPKPLQRAMDAALRPVMNVNALGAPSPVAGAAGSGVTLNYSPSITINGSGPGAESSFAAMLQQHKQELIRILNEQSAYKNRVGYA